MTQGLVYPCWGGGGGAKDTHLVCGVPGEEELQDHHADQEHGPRDYSGPLGAVFGFPIISPIAAGAQAIKGKKSMGKLAFVGW